MSFEGRGKSEEGVDFVAGAAGTCAGLLRVGREAAREREAGVAVRCAGLLRVGREAAQGLEAGAAAQKSKNFFLLHYQRTK